MNEAISLEHLPLAWTQRPVTQTSPPEFAESVGFAPTVSNVVDHLVEMAVNIAANCKISDREFFSDLEATYNYLNRPENVVMASKCLLSRHGDKPVWLNEDMTLGTISQPENSKPPATLKWLKSQSIIHGVSYDLRERNIYSAQTSIEGYGDLLRGCGSLVVQDVKTKLSDENIENHGNSLLGHIREMIKSSDNLCDLKIIVGQKEMHVHKLLIGAVSSYFRGLACGQWKEMSTGVLNLDNLDVKDNGEGLYGTPHVVQSVIDWIYNGFLELDDGELGDENAIEDRLNHYLDVLKLADVWDIPMLRGHIENRLMKQWRKFIRPENVLDIKEIAESYNATGLRQFCDDYIEKNSTTVKEVAEQGQ